MVTPIILLLFGIAVISGQSPGRRSTTRTSTATTRTATISTATTGQMARKWGTTLFPTLQKKAIVKADQAPPQSVNPWEALDTIRGRSALTTEEIQLLMTSAVAGVDYPALEEVPQETKIRCENMKQPGWYADIEHQCQVFRRCDPSGNMFSFLCPATTLFNQISLTCDYFFNVDCSNAAKFYDYSNSRLYHENWLLLGNK